jgi:PAS domain-containing protein
MPGDAAAPSTHGEEIFENYPAPTLVSASPIRLGDATLGTVIDNIVEGVVASTVEGHVIHWNPAAVEMHGYTSLDECTRRLPEFQSTLPY